MNFGIKLFATGTVRRKERGDLVVEVGKLKPSPWRERVPEKSPRRASVAFQKLEQQGRGPELILSRSSLNLFVSCLKWKWLKLLMELLRLQHG